MPGPVLIKCGVGHLECEALPAILSLPPPQPLVHFPDMQSVSALCH